MRVIACRIGCAAKIEEIYRNLHYMQEFVGGYIETVSSANGYILVCNAEGTINNLPDNPVMDYYHSAMMNWPDIIHGDYFITYFDGNESFTDVPDTPLTAELLNLLNVERSGAK